MSPLQQQRALAQPLAAVSDNFNTLPGHERARLIVYCVPWAMEQYGPVYDRLIEIGGDL